MRQLAQRLRDLLVELIRDDGAQTTIEYALLTGIVAVASISMLEGIRGRIVDIFEAVANALQSAPVGDAG